MRRIRLFEEFIELISPKRKINGVNKRIAIVPGWKTY